LERTKKIWKEGMENYEIHEAVRKLRFFMVEDLSRFYMKVVKERKGDEDWKRKMLLLYKALFETTLMLSIFAPHTSEQAYQSFFKKYLGKESVFLHSFSDVDESLISDVVEKKMNMTKEIVSAILDLRQRAGVNLRWPLSAAYIHAEHEEVVKTVKEAKDIIAQLTNVKDVVIGEGKGEGQELSFGKVWLDTALTHELGLEGYYAEVKRRVQMLRKQMNLVESDRIEVEMDGDEVFREVIEKFREVLCKDVGALSVRWIGLEKGKEFKIKGKVLKIAITLKKPSSI
jgi:isoleucyl-tRNA synthetase